MPRNPISTGADVKKMFGMPKILSQPKVFVMDPKTGKTEIDNPLYSFTFPTEELYNSTGRKKINFKAEAVSIFAFRVNGT